MTDPNQHQNVIDNINFDPSLADFDASYDSEHNNSIVLTPEEVFDSIIDRAELNFDEIPPLEDLPSGENKSESIVKSKISIYENLTPRGSLEDLSEGATNKPLRHTRQNTEIKLEEITPIEEADPS